jgi:rhodanese-related sulfurtransferase
VIRNVTPKEAKRLIDEEGYRYLDVRTVEEFAAGHPEGAVNVPVAFGGMRPNPDFVPVVEANFARDEKLVLGCKSGGRSARAAEMLASAGYSNVVNMDGGFLGRYAPTGALAQPGWSDEGLPTSEENGDGTSYTSLAARRGA